jgi:hypothetical protein
MWVTALLFMLFSGHQLVHPDPTPDPIYEGVPEPLAIINMHACRYDGVQLFSRSQVCDIQFSQFEQLCAEWLSAPELIAALAVNNPSAVAYHHEVLAELRDAMAGYNSFPLRSLTNADLKAARAWIGIDEGGSIKVVPGPLNSFANTTEYGVVLATTPMTATGYQDYRTLMHECTHHVQQVMKRSTSMLMYCTTGRYEAFAPDELAAMIVENCAAIEEGWTADDFCDLDRGAVQWRIAHEPNMARTLSWPNARTPIVPGDLVYQYCCKYGPAFNGDIAHDLTVLRSWTSHFEALGDIDFRAFPKCFGAGWMVLARREQAIGHLSALASTCQTWLAINGQPSLYSQFVKPMLQERQPIFVPPAYTEIVRFTDSLNLLNREKALTFLDATNP